jgi:hypothetical protein
MTLSAVVSVVIGYVAVQCGLRLLDPTSIRKTYLPGIVATFEMNRVFDSPIEAACKCKEVRLLLRGFQRFYDKNHPKASRMKIAYGMDLAVESQRTMVGMSGSDVRSADARRDFTLRQRLFVCQAVGVMFMLRRSEHVYYKSGKAPLLRKHLTFFDKAGGVIPYWRIGSVPAKKVVINVTFSKTDHSGFGRRPYHLRQEELSGACVVCILEQWVAFTRDSYGASESTGLYEVPTFENLSMETLHRVMEATVRSMGIADSHVIRATSHSLRYGGATMMAAAGFPQYLIAHYGGWREDSEALKRYAKPSEESIERVSEFMTRVTYRNPSRLYIEDLIVRVRGSART